MKLRERCFRLYERTVLSRPVLTLVMATAVTLFLGWHAQHFSLDASADSLTLEHDANLEYYRHIRSRYGSDDFLLVTYTPREPFPADRALSELRALRDDLRSTPNVAAVTSILDVPLLYSPPFDLDDIASGIRYLEDATTDRQLAWQELTTSPLYSNLLVGASGRTTALRIDMQDDAALRQLRIERDALREKQYLAELSDEESLQLAAVSNQFDERSRESLARQARDIEAIRAVLGRHEQFGELHLGGVPMIVADSISFIRRDLLVFGIAVFVFLMLILEIAFHRQRWAFLPLLTCAATCVSMIGLLGWLGWRVTIVSSNFVSLLLILCLALTLHIIVRYREIHLAHPDGNQLMLVGETIRHIFAPCVYTALTTIVAFGSLIVSGIRPVIDFGWMMSIGIVVAFLMAFTFFPAAMMLMKPGTTRARNDITDTITRFFASLIRRRQKVVLALFACATVIGLLGTTRLTVENRFIDYYKESTEIYRGMEIIDRELGGTTPLDVIVDMPAMAASEVEPLADSANDEFEDIYADESDAEAGITSRSYWFNNRKIGTIREMHAFLDELDDTGKVISIATFAELIEPLDADILSDNFALSILYEKLPDDVRSTLFTPYLSADGDQLRFSIRVFESDPALKRAEFLRIIEDGLSERFGLAASQVHLTGMLVLYNNMLQSLFRSQIMTLAAVFLAITVMFLILFRSFRTAVIAIIPNVVAASLVLGIMGWFGIPLDLMTTTIAAITVGIGVDDTIHYVHRFRREFAQDGDYWATVFRCHRSIGRAIYYTSVTIMLGFSILALSRFVPTIYFGVLTSLAMLLALLANITLLPLLMVVFRSQGPAAGAARPS